MSQSGENTPTNMVDATVKLLNEGDKCIQLDDRRRDVVLVIGNTGAGKSTLTKVLAKIEDLDCYKAVDRYLIRDKNETISSEKSCIVSQTIFPELIVDEETNTAFYDLPGFMDTRNESVEIANAWFMQKVADHAKRVKLLFVINHSSLLTGETRTDVKSFLEQTANLVKNPRHFSRSIALVASKARGDMCPEDIIDGITLFLSRAKRSLRDVISEESMRIAAEDLIDAILSKDRNGDFNRIAYFSEPTEAGPLKDLESVMENRAQISQVLHNNIVYADNAPGNFGLSISSDSQFLILKIAEKMKLQISELMQSIGKGFETELSNTVQSSSYAELGTLLNQQGRFHEMVHSLMKTPRTQRKAFFQKFNEIASLLHLEASLGESGKELQQTVDNLCFLEKFTGDEFSASVTDWSTPIKFSADFFKRSVEQKMKSYIDEMGNKLPRVSQELARNLNENTTTLQAEPDKLGTFLQRYNTTLVALNEELAESKSVNAFIQLAQSRLKDLDANVSTSTLVGLKDDVGFESIHFSLYLWTKSLDALQAAVRQQVQIHSMKCASAEERQVIEQQCERQRAEQAARLATMNADFDNKCKKLEDELQNKRKDDEKMLKSLKQKHKNEMRLLLETAENAKKETQKQVDDIQKQMKEQQEKFEKEKEESNKRGNLLGEIMEGIETVASIIVPVLGAWKAIKGQTIKGQIKPSTGSGQ